MNRGTVVQAVTRVIEHVIALALALATTASGLMGTEAMSLGQLLQAKNGGIHGEALLTAISAGAV
ncbi:MAG: hypothetical protein HYY95_08925, partial [Candidatus Rokubacteria bacterium]|nr:hypothetical protein [Candidatus Rokubacteria bacterium]